MHSPLWTSVHFAMHDNIENTSIPRGEWNGVLYNFSNAGLCFKESN